MRILLNDTVVESSKVTWDECTFYVRDSNSTYVKVSVPEDKVDDIIYQLCYSPVVDLSTYNYVGVIGGE